MTTENKSECVENAKKLVEGIEKELEKKGEKIAKKVERPAEYIATAVVNGILIWLFPRLMDWLPFLTDSFQTILLLLNISFLATILINLIFLFYDGQPFKGLFKALLNMWGLVVTISLYYIFPFDFSPYNSADWNLIVRIILIVGIFGTLVGFITEFIGAFFPKQKNVS